MGFEYFYGSESDMFTFYRIPKVIVVDEMFKNVTSDAKLLYGLMLDRMTLSSKNNWIDKDNKVFIYFSMDEIMAQLNVGKNKALKLISELDQDGIGLIERIKQGQGKPARIYVKNYIDKESLKFKNQTSENDAFCEVYPSNPKRFQNQTSRGLKSKLQEVSNSNPNNNKSINTKVNDTESNLILSDEIEMREKLHIEELKEAYPFDSTLIEEIFNLITEVVFSKGRDFEIASSIYHAEYVRRRFLMLEDRHIEYVLECFNNNTVKVRNIKKYLLAALFNAPSTIQGYYKAEVKYDMSH